MWLMRSWLQEYFLPYTCTLLHLVTSHLLTQGHHVIAWFVYRREDWNFPSATWPGALDFLWPHTAVTLCQFCLRRWTSEVTQSKELRWIHQDHPWVLEAPDLLEFLLVLVVPEAQLARVYLRDQACLVFPWLPSGNAPRRPGYLSLAELLFWYTHDRRFHWRLISCLHFWRCVFDESFFLQLRENSARYSYDRSVKLPSVLLFKIIFSVLTVLS